MNFNRIFVVGDPHGNFDWLANWCRDNNTTVSDALIVLGDSGILYYGAKKWREKHIKDTIAACPITLLVIRGNHDRRPEHDNMEFVVLEEDPIVPGGYWYDPDYPTIWHIADGSCLDLNGKLCLFIGGAYSVDKEYRKTMGWQWFEDEELSREEQLNILDKLSGSGYHPYFDFVFTHTCPEEVIPTDLFLCLIDQTKVSRSMEKFFTEVSHYITFDKWYFGHYHSDRHINEHFTMLYNQVEQIYES